MGAIDNCSHFFESNNLLFTNKVL